MLATKKLGIQVAKESIEKKPWNTLTLSSNGFKFLRAGIEMAKHNKGNKAPVAQNANTAQSAVASAWQKATAGIGSLASLVQGDASAVALPDLEKDQVSELDKVEPEKKLELERLLADISDVAKRVRDLHEDAQKRTEDLARKEEAFSRRSDENKKRTEEIHKLDEELKQRQVEIKKSESSLADKERELEKRELDARSGFAAQNVAALSELKKEIVELESKKTEIQLGILQAEQKALDDESARALALMEREAEIANKERGLQQQQRRLDAEWKELERERAQIREDALREAEQEIAGWKTAHQRARDSRQKVYDELESTRQEIEQFRELSEVLAGRSAREILDELAAHKRRVTQLENQLASSEDDQLRAENEALRKLRDEQKAQLDEVHLDLADAKAQLHRLRLGVSDKENLEREKRALEKNNQILSARLNDLGKTVDDLTQSQQSEKPFPQMAWMDSASTADWIKDRKAKELSLPEQDVPDLKKFSVELQHRIAQAEEGATLHFRLEDIQLLIAGLAMSQLHIFQGISGTGKTSLAKAFAKAVGGHCTDIAVQAGWRDRDDLLGHYNAFEKRFYERDCLQGLYRAQTAAYKDRCNIILLDEMNLSRPEQYFAEFLSALEKNDSRDRLISLSESQLPNAPALLVEGRRIRVPHNVWFVGTANHDETTNEFADKTYDRAHVMTLPRHEAGFKVEPKPKASFSYGSLIERFDAAVTQNADEVSELLAELTTGPLTSILQDRFDLGWGNRLERQAMRFVPVYMAAGGRKEDALDHLLASRVFRRGKVTGRYDATIDDLNAIEQALTTVWKGWKSEPRRSMALLAEDRRRKERGA
ncbi:MAG: AAA family ATPase [Thiomonas sp.]|uniref:AAA family ATPase n=1 Tax=Thiomonas sp. TaxID=2047785 RepID=UPI002A367EF8|nr:AAA family ATPase [Thiomonas sp.]MDY0329690.1 AAA family ATPase [Thiomonas sp.]